MDDVSWGVGAVGCRVDVYVRGRMLPQSTDYWDGNWLESDIVVDVGAFHGKIAAVLRVDELQRFRKELEVVYMAVAGAAHLESLEEWLTLGVKVDAFGHVTVDGQIQDRPGMGNRLIFRIDRMRPGRADRGRLLEEPSTAQVFPVSRYRRCTGRPGRWRSQRWRTWR